jgi:transcriptional regulator with XRE-family HTH domain
VRGQLQRIVGDNLRAYRTARGLTQEEFASVWGVHRTYMGKLERGECNLTLRKVESIADRLKVEPIALLSQQIAFSAGAAVKSHCGNGPLAATYRTPQNSTQQSASPA